MDAYTCPTCHGHKSRHKMQCDKCDGTARRRDYDRATACLVSCLNFAAIEEMRFRATVRRLNPPAF